MSVATPAVCLLTCTTTPSGWRTCAAGTGPHAWTSSGAVLELPRLIEQLRAVLDGLD